MAPRKSAKRANETVAGAPAEPSAPAIKSDTKHGASQTVWVGCKLPKGLTLELFTEETVDRPTFGGGIKPTKVFMRTGQTIRLKGYAVPHGMVPNYPIIGDFGLTEVPRKFWDKFCEQNREFDMLKKGLIFAHGEESSTRAYAREHENLKCGLEPMMQNGDPRAEQPNSENLTDIQMDTDRPTRAA
jgi:hypothetical protein